MATRQQVPNARIYPPRPSEMPQKCTTNAISHGADRVLKLMPSAAENLGSSSSACGTKRTCVMLHIAKQVLSLSLMLLFNIAHAGTQSHA